jgi:diketogulonate reductase-like aldo/keto reductase
MIEKTAKDGTSLPVLGLGTWTLGGGHTEELLGEAIKGFDRNDLFITTKVSPSQAAIAWLLAKPMVITIPKSSQIGHLKQNMEAVDIQLDEDDIALLEQ